ncbi:MAG: SGNH/GDSL hydrolase family protein [Lachnospiraceae bacterium]|nr:SGNH/GDSL hydrolase family protein [Lachnospiraceae bacterium]
MTNEIYILRDQIIEASPNGDSFTEAYYLNGRITEQAKMMTPALSLDYLKQLESIGTFVNLADGINVRIITDNVVEAKLSDSHVSAEFSLQISDSKGYHKKWAKTVPLNGDVINIPVDLNDDDAEAKLASFQIDFPCYMLAVISVSFHLRESLPIAPMPPDKPVDFAAPAYQEMLKRSLLSTGNLNRLQKAIAKAKAGEDVTIAYIGGSITQGAGAKPINNRCYAKVSCESFIKRFAKDKNKVHFVKAGIGGTPSQLGIARYHRDILAPENRLPDIVIIEFAVNDYADETQGVCYESLCLMAYEGAGNPAVILMFSVFANDQNLEERLDKVGYHYGFPMVSVKQAVVPQYDCEDAVLSRRQYFHDILHPSNTGHQIMADSLDYLWKAADELLLTTSQQIATDCPQTADKHDFALKNPVIGDRYKNLKLITRNNISGHQAISHYEPGGFTEVDMILQSVERNDDAFATPQFTDNWHCNKASKLASERIAEQFPLIDSPDCFSFKMTIECRDLLLLYKDADSPHFAPAEIIIDGVCVRTLDPCVAGWTHCGTTFILNSDEKTSRTIEIKPKTTETKNAFTILGFGYTD